MDEGLSNCNFGACMVMAGGYCWFFNQDSASCHSSKYSTLMHFFSCIIIDYVTILFLLRIATQSTTEMTSSSQLSPVTSLAPTLGSMTSSIPMKSIFHSSQAISRSSSYQSILPGKASSVSAHPSTGTQSTSQCMKQQCMHVCVCALFYVSC